MGRNVWVCFVSTALTYITLNALEILMTCVNSVNIMVQLESLKSQLLKTFFQIENWLNTEKVMGTNVCICFALTVLTYIAQNALHVLIPCLNTADIHSIHNMQCISHFDPLYQPSQHEKMKPLHPCMYTQMR